MQWLENRALVPTLVDVQERAEQVTQHDLQRAQRMLARGDDPAEVLQWLSHTLSQRFLHGPLTTLKNSQGEQRDTLLQVLPELLPTTRVDALSGDLVLYWVIGLHLPVLFFACPRYQGKNSHERIHARSFGAAVASID